MLTGAISNVKIGAKRGEKVASFWNKRINKRLKWEVARDLGVEETKIQELIDGKRHIGGETMDKVLQSINDNSENRVAKDLEVLDWYTNTDLKALRKEWGYGQTELADKLGLNYSTLNAVESKYQFRGRVTKNIHLLYDFYQNEFNKKIGNETTTANVTLSVPTIETKDIVNDEVSFDVQPIFKDEILIKIDNEGNITYIENGKEIQNITEIHLDKIGNEKPMLEIRLTRLF